MNKPTAKLLVPVLSIGLAAALSGCWVTE
jgi:hypothetical protein